MAREDNESEREYGGWYGNKCGLSRKDRGHTHTQPTTDKCTGDYQQYLTDMWGLGLHISGSMYNPILPQALEDQD
jgi:hypothetical protein